MSTEQTLKVLDLLVIANAVAMLCGMTINVVLVRRLKVLHPEQWVALGSPHLFANSIGNGLRFQRYIFGSGHRALNDETLDRLALASRVSFCIVVLLLVTAIVVIALQ